MSNSLTAGFPDHWAKEYQVVWHRENVGKVLCDTSYNNQMRKGDVLNRVYRSSDPSNQQIDPYTRGSDITIQDITDTAETLTVNREFAKGIYVDDYDAIQSQYNVAEAYGRDHSIFMSNQMDADILGEYSNATSNVDDADLGGTDGNGLTLTTSNVLQVISAVKKYLRKQNVPLTDAVGLISPEFEQILIEYGAGRDTNMGDEANKNGFLTRFYGFNMHVTNQTAGSAVLAMATDPTAGDTVVINGVTFTAANPIGTTAGNFLVGTSADASRLALTGLINTPGTTDANGVALSASDQRKLENITATNDATANTLTIVHKGAGVISVSETLTAAADVWTTTKQKQHCLFGRKGAISLVTQSLPRMKVQDAQKRFGSYILNGTLYGLKTFADGAKQLVSVDINSSSF